MMSPRISIVPAIAALLVGGCVDLEDFDPPSIVKSWRVLAIVADPPEANPGQDISLQALVVTPDGETVLDPATHNVRFRWSACVSGERVVALSGLTYDPERPIVGCDGVSDDQVVALPDIDGTATAPGAASAGLFERIDELAPLLGDVLGDDLPPELLSTAVRQVGLPLTVQLHVEPAGGGEPLVRAFKRLTISERETPGTNPPPPQFDLDDVTISATEEPFRCEPEGGRLVVPRGTQTVLAPSEDDESWRETYLVIDVRGEVAESRERPYYSWFSTGGVFDQETTAAPARQELWETPDEPGDYPLWLVVRDGHGGTSACEATVRVE